MPHQPVARSSITPRELCRDPPILSGLLQEDYRACGKVAILPHTVQFVFKQQLGFISYQDTALHLLNMLICLGKFMEKQIIVPIRCLGKPSMSPLGLNVEEVTVYDCRLLT